MDRSAHLSGGSQHAVENADDRRDPAVGMTTSSAIERVRVRVLPDGRMTRADAARYLGVTPKTLAMWQLQGKGPRSVRVGGLRFYYVADCDAFIRRGEAA